MRVDPCCMEALAHRRRSAAGATKGGRRRAFGDMKWEVPEILDRMDEAAFPFLASRLVGGSLRDDLALPNDSATQARSRALGLPVG
jgi:hypothetical protein